ncbi:hypothetical protein LINGRAHAP2_LOCUS2981 [Linum grandiflorum]
MVTEMYVALLQYFSEKSKKPNEEAKVGGCLILPAIFLLIHSGSIRDFFGIDLHDKHTEWPLGKEWGKIIYSHSASSYRNTDISALKNNLDLQLIVEFNTYKNLTGMHKYLKSQCYMQRAVCPMFNNWFCVFHLPYESCIAQFNIETSERNQMATYFKTLIGGGAAKSYPELWTQKFDDNVPLRNDVMTADQPWVTNPDEEDREGTGHEEPAHQEEPDSSRSHREEEDTVIWGNEVHNEPTRTNSPNASSRNSGESSQGDVSSPRMVTPLNKNPLNQRKGKTMTDLEMHKLRDDVSLPLVTAGRKRQWGRVKRYSPR